MGLKVITQDNKTYDLSFIGGSLISFDVKPPEFKGDPFDESTEDMDGGEDIDVFYKGRTIACEIQIKAYDELDYPLVRNKVFKMFESRKPFYVIDDREPMKRWLVRASYDVEQIIYDRGKLDITFKSKFVHAESVWTTQDGLDSGTGLIGFGMNWDTGKVETAKYKYDVTNGSATYQDFNIWNGGDFTIDPRRHWLVIELRGPSTNLLIHNMSTGDKWQYLGTTFSGNLTQLYGVKSRKYTTAWQSIFKDSNRQIITLAPGWNYIRVVGMTDNFTFEVKTRFLYL
jgi:Phage tail protein